MIAVYLLLLSPSLILGVEIVSSPDENIWVENGGEKTMICTTNTGWQWCQWEHTDLNNEIQKYQTGQEYTTLETGDTQVNFSDLTETNCGIKIMEADPVKHQVTRNFSTLIH